MPECRYRGRVLRIKSWDAPTFRHLETENKSLMRLEEDMDIGVYKKSTKENDFKKRI